MATSAKYELEFFTATILEWHHILSDDAHKRIIIDSLNFLVKNDRVFVTAFVIMSNHIHLLWHIRAPHKRPDVQRDFLKHTAQMILKELKSKDAVAYKKLLVDAADRKYQLWERNPLSVGVWNKKVLEQKLNYIHQNPVKAGLSDAAGQYKYSSAAYYETGKDEFGFLTHYQD